MNKSFMPTKLDSLVLALVKKTVSMHRVVEEGFTPGQVARALLALEDLGLIVDGERGLSLSDYGLATLNEATTHINSGDWIVPLEGAKVGQGISVCDIYLPESHYELD